MDMEVDLLSLSFQGFASGFKRIKDIYISLASLGHLQLRSHDVSIREQSMNEMMMELVNKATSTKI